MQRKFAFMTGHIGATPARYRMRSVLAAVMLMIGCGVCASGEAQLSFGVNIGLQPACPYGYYDYAPYSCSPYGYYGPEWFNNGLFIGAGPWFGGPRGFRGYVNRRYDPRFGYRGGFPDRGAQGYYTGGPIHGFSGNQFRDGRGGYGGGLHSGGRGGFHGGGHHR